MNKQHGVLSLLTLLILMHSSVGLADVSTDRLSELTQASASAQQAQQSVVQYQQQQKAQFQESQKSLAPTTIIGAAPMTQPAGTAPLQGITPGYTTPSAVGISTPPAAAQPAAAPDTITGFSTPPSQNNNSNAQQWNYNY